MNFIASKKRFRNPKALRPPLLPPPMYRGRKNMESHYLELPNQIHLRSGLKNTPPQNLRYFYLFFKLIYS